MTEQVDLQVAQLVGGALIPLVTAIVTKHLAGGHVKAITLLFLAATTGFIEQLVAGGGAWSWEQFLTSFVITFVLGVAAHFGLYKPTGAADAVARRAAPRTGIGREMSRSPSQTSEQ